MRGRLIQQFLVSIARLDTAATAAVPGGGYDPDFHEPLPVDDGSLLGSSSRRYHPVDQLHCQLDRRKEWGNPQFTRAGEDVDCDIVVVLHWPELEKLGLLDADRQPLFKAGDKVVELHDVKGNLEERFDDPPGMFVDGISRAGYGLNAFGTPKTNLLYLYCNYDRKGTPERKRT